MKKNKDDILNKERKDSERVKAHLLVTVASSYTEDEGMAAKQEVKKGECVMHAGPMS